MIFQGLFLLILLLFIAPFILRRVRILEGRSFIWQSLFFWGGLLLFLIVLHDYLGLEQEEDDIFMQNQLPLTEPDRQDDEFDQPYESPYEFNEQQKGTEL